MRYSSRIVKEKRKTTDNATHAARETVDNVLGWDAMIRDARKQIEDLNFSIEVFERRKKAGEPWPGEQGQSH